MARPVFKAPPRGRSPKPPSTFSKRVKPAGALVNLDDNAVKASSDPNMWAMKHAPQSYAELALHKNKLEEILGALNPSSSNRVVVLSGPSGSSKSAAVRLICKEQGRDVIEFLAPEASIGSTGLMGSFREFLVGASMYSRESSIVFVDDMPNIFHEDTRRQFEESLIDWANERFPQPILVVAFTEVEVSAHYSEAAVVSRVLGNLVTNQEHCCWIKVNAVNATLISKALRLVLAREGKTCSPAAVKEISQCGDIRNAINALQLFLMSPSSGGANSLVRGFPVQLFHAIGKIIWGTSKEGSLEEALDAFTDSLDTFNLTILDNYCSAKHSRLKLSAAATVAECLSEADIGLPYLGALAAAEAIQTTEPDERVTKKFEGLRFTQFHKWKRQEHESRSLAIGRISESRRYKGPATFAGEILDEAGYESQLQKPAELVPDISSDDDDF